MSKRDPRVDAYIAKSAEFAKPILSHLREVVHEGCPDIEEDMKWSFPHFIYKGILCSMASFKQHCAFSFWDQTIRGAADQDGKSREAMGQFGRITTLSDLPKKSVLLKQVKDAVKLKDSGIKTPRPVRTTQKKALVIPDYLEAALKKNKKALATFSAFSDSNKREYVEWIAEAKTAETRQKRLAQAIEWMAEGKVRNWKYVRK